MREGGERVAVIRPENGYGEKGHKKAGIPANCTFLIDIKLVKCLTCHVSYKKQELFFMREGILLYRKLTIDKKIGKHIDSIRKQRKTEERRNYITNHHINNIEILLQWCICSSNRTRINTNNIINAFNTRVMCLSINQYITLRLHAQLIIFIPSLQQHPMLLSLVLQ